MRTGNYNKTEIEIISIDELDGEKPEQPQERNLLREKTFNSELNLLVSKIFNNERKSEIQDIAPRETDLLQRNTLMLQCEKLLYQLKHSEEYSSSTSFYNPFDTDINVYDDIDDTADYIKTGLLQCGFPGYQILKYNFNDKSYRSDINNLDESFSSDMYFSINDPLIRRINDCREGYIIDSGMISSDRFFAKKFLNSDAADHIAGSYYIIKISSLFNSPENMKKLDNKISKFEDFLSPLLMIKLDESVSFKAVDIYGILLDKAALPLMLYFLKNRIKFSVTNYSYEDTLLMIELFIKSSVNSRLKSYIFYLKDYSRKENMFIYKFLLSKIRRILSMDSMILRIGINRAVLITTSDVEDINICLARINHGSDLISMQPVDYTEFLNSKEFVNLFL